LRPVWGYNPQNHSGGTVPRVLKIWYGLNRIIPGLYIYDSPHNYKNKGKFF